MGGGGVCALARSVVREVGGDVALLDSRGSESGGRMEVAISLRCR